MNISDIQYIIHTLFIIPAIFMPRVPAPITATLTILFRERGDNFRI